LSITGLFSTPVDGDAVKLTCSPILGLPFASSTVAVAMATTVPSPAMVAGATVTDTVCTGPAVLVSEKIAVTFPAVVVTVHAPATVLAVAVVVARPVASVVVVVGETTPPAVPAETAKDTGVPLKGIPAASVTLTVRGANVAPATADWALPLATATAAGGLGVIVRPAVLVAPPYVAVTVTDPAATPVHVARAQLAMPLLDELKVVAAVTSPRELPKASEAVTAKICDDPTTMDAALGDNVVCETVPGLTVRLAVAALPESVPVTVWDPALVDEQVAPVQVPLVMVKVVDGVTSPRGLPNWSKP
jgi:hypothetical protein